MPGGSDGAQAASGGGRRRYLRGDGGHVTQHAQAVQAGSAGPLHGPRHQQPEVATAVDPRRAGRHSQQLTEVRHRAAEQDQGGGLGERRAKDETKGIGADRPGERQGPGG
jgi:hypothetical protein